jgi:hypothetical protein
MAIVQAIFEVIPSGHDHRPGLEAASCECCRAIRDQFDRLVGRRGMPWPWDHQPPGPPDPGSASCCGQDLVAQRLSGEAKLMIRETSSACRLVCVLR